MSTFQVKDPDRIGVPFLGVGRMGRTHVRDRGRDPQRPGRRRRRPRPRGGRAGPRRCSAPTGRRPTSSMRSTTRRSRPSSSPRRRARTPGLIEAALRAGKAVWSEKPIALDLAETSRVVALWRETGLPVQLGFMRRFDPGYVRAKALIDAGEIGRIEQFRAYSRDTYPPSVEFLRDSGGSFLDMSVHDFDLARFLVGEVEEVQAWGSVVFDERFAEVGDVDTAVTMLRFQNGALGVVEMSRHSEWGYDIRTEVAGPWARSSSRRTRRRRRPIRAGSASRPTTRELPGPVRGRLPGRARDVLPDAGGRRHADARTRGRPRDAPARDRRDPELAREPAGPRRRTSRQRSRRDRSAWSATSGPGPARAPSSRSRRRASAGGTCRSG